MRRIIKSPEPQYWKDFVRKNPETTYKELEKTEEGRQLRRKVREQISADQGWLCAYCCGKITMDTSLNEHIQPEDRYPARTMDYRNLIVSCKENEKKRTCGARKGSKYDEKLFVSPLAEDCEQQFAYAPDGEMIGLTEKGRYTIDLLGLNTYELKEARKAAYHSTQWCDEESIQWYLEPHNGEMQPYVDILEYMFKSGYYSAAVE